MRIVSGGGRGGGTLCNVDKVSLLAGCTCVFARKLQMNLFFKNTGFSQEVCLNSNMYLNFRNFVMNIIKEQNHVTFT